MGFVLVAMIFTLGMFWSAIDDVEQGAYPYVTGIFATALLSQCAVLVMLVLKL